MKFTKQFIEILKSFQNIHSNIVLESERISIRDESETILAQYNPEEEFDKALPIYDLREVNEIIKLFNHDVEVDLTDDEYFQINNKDNTMSQRFVYPEISMLELPDPELMDSINELENVFDFDLNTSDLKNIISGGSINKSKFISIRGENGDLFLEANMGSDSDFSVSNRNVFRSKIGTSNVEFKIYIFFEALSKIITRDCKVSILKSEDGGAFLVKIKLKDLPLTYYLNTESSSEYIG